MASVLQTPLRVAFWATLRAGALRMLLVRLRWGPVLLATIGALYMLLWRLQWVPVLLAALGGAF